MSAIYQSLDEALTLLSKISQTKGEQFRTIAYERARVFPDDAGDHIRTKIKEYRKTGHIKELDELLQNRNIIAAMDFNTILGFGPVIINSLIAQGITSREQIISTTQRGKLKLSRVQRLGLTYYEDLHKKIPRSNVRRASENIFVAINIAIAQVIKQLHRDISLYIDIAGSYRRGMPESNDIDILVSVTKKLPDDVAQYMKDHFLYMIHSVMKNRDDFVDFIVIGKQKYSFLFFFEWVMHIDIIYAPYESYYPALLYFTGSQRFNIWMREFCKKNGFTLNQNRLEKNGVAIEVNCEEDIFKAIGTNYVAPTLRV
jgi:DNA polymerase/3'-5' exonuclease PolX